MAQNIVEKLREEAVTHFFDDGGALKKVWPTWRKVICRYAATPTAREIFDLGDHLKEVFYSTNTKTPSQKKKRDKPGSLSKAGSLWESLVCWYLNLCNIGRHTVCLKRNKDLVPLPISQSLTFNYKNYTSNSESDLIVVTFPEKKEYCIDKDQIKIKDQNGNDVDLYSHEKYNYMDILNALVARDFSEIEIHIVQCKTNWNENSQIPMLWDLIYSLAIRDSFFSIGCEGYSMKDVKKFTYAFATVPTVDDKDIRPGHVCVSRVCNLSGGNYWGLPSKEGVAKSLKEMLGKNLTIGSTKRHLDTISEIVSDLDKGKTFDYFNFM